jgi:endonuclease YncB( thermonuclease family)
MNKPIPSHIANIALAVGVAAAMGIAVALTFTHSDHRTPTRSDVSRRGEPADDAMRSTPRSTAAAGFSVTRLRAASNEPFEPPPPPIEQTAAATAPPPERQVAALPTADANTDAAAAPPAFVLPATPADRDADIAPRRDRPMPSRTAAKRDRRPSAPAPKQQTAAIETPVRDNDTDAGAGDEPEGVKLAGPAIVTGPLELNIDGKPLELYGVKPPTGDDTCSPGGDYAARSCLDVSRQALAARIGLDGDVTCRILAFGGRSALPAVCTDSKGADLATYLVAHGFALADPNEIVDYSAAEARAKSARAGLWTYR